LRNPLLALRSAPPVFAIAEAERIARDLYGLAAELRPMSGERDCNFHVRTADLREYVLKIVDGSADPQTTDCQVRVLRHLADEDPSLPSPRLYATLQGTDLGLVERGGDRHHTCLMSYLPGRLLADTAPGQALLANAGAMLARVDRALQGFFHPALAQRIAWDVRRLPELMDLLAGADVAAWHSVEYVAGALRQRLPLLRRLRAQAIHGDGHAANLLVDPAGDEICGVLDFGDMIHGPLMLEPAVAMAELLIEGRAGIEETSAVLEGYVRVQSLEAADIELLFDAVTARHAVTILLHAWRRRHDPGGAGILEQGAAGAADSLARLLSAGRIALTEQWHEAAGTSPPRVVAVDLARRHRLLGVGAELFYEQPLHLVRGEGVWLHDPAGRRYLDVYNNVAHVGHCHPTVVRAVQRQTAMLNTHTRYLHGGILSYAEELTARCPAHLDACMFVNSGSEANDLAWRMAQFATGARGAVVMAHAYHGITEAVAALTPGPGQPHDPRVVTLEPPPALSVGESLDASGLEAAAADADRAVQTLRARGLAPAAFFIDSALTSSGIFDPPPAWLAAIVSRLRAAGALYVGDEVQYGLGRSGSHFWGFERRGLAGGGPDIVTLGKPVGNGYPVGVVIANRALIEAFQARFGFFSTFGGNPVAAAAGLAVLRVIDRERMVANAGSTGQYLRRRLEEIAGRHRCLGAVRGAGLLLGLEVRGADAAAARARTREIVDRLAARHAVLIGSEGPAANILKLRPPMPFRPEHADLLVEAIAAAAAAIDAGDHRQPTRRSSSGTI
jgi:4-aminobutyrate aminotransferase-like enzyme/Ser/Thr protein kinase RdoA (MazF antagonist)